jgi:flavocytochrome c
VSGDQSNATTTRAVDVVVVGSGVAGLCAAVEAAEAGSTVVVLERDAGLGGASGMSGGACNIVGTPLQTSLGIEDDVDLALEDWIRTGGPTADAEWARRYLERSFTDVYEWCERLGITWAGLSQPDGNSVPRVHTPAGWGLGIIEALAGRAKSLGVEINAGFDVDEIVMANGAAQGIRGSAGGARHQISAGAVVICTGGFASSHELLLEVAPQLRDLPRLLSGGGPSALGQGYRLLLDAGAQFACLDHIWLYPMGTPDPDDGTGVRGVGVRGVSGDIWVNSSGRRFVDEGHRDGGTGARALLAQPGQTAWSIFNSAELPNVRLLGNERWGTPAGSNRAAMEEFWRSTEFVWRADNPADLAQRIGLPVDAFEATVRSFNASVLAGDRYDREQHRSLEALSPLSGPGLMAVQFFPIAVKTFGGVRTDMTCRVVDQASTVIPGLFAAGEVAGMAGGCINGRAALEGTMFGPCLYSGRVAGTAAAESKGRPASGRTRIPSPRSAHNPQEGDPHMTQPVLPEHLLPDDKNFAEVNGITVRKGTMGAFLANLRILSSMPRDAPNREAIVEQVRQALPTMRENGLFELFTFRSPDLAEAIGIEQ